MIGIYIGKCLKKYYSLKRHNKLPHIQDQHEVMVPWHLT